VKLPNRHEGELRADEATLELLADSVPIDLVVLGGVADTVRSP
jgi:hypothetical protein